MKLSWGIYALFYGAATFMLLISILKGQAWRQVGVPAVQKSWVKLGSGLLVAGVFSLLAMSLQLDIASAWPYLMGAAGFYSLLAGFSVPSETLGIILLMLGFILFSGFPDVSTMQLPLLATFLGLAFGKLCSPDDWVDFSLPGCWLVGVYWLTFNASDVVLASQVSLLTIFISVTLIARSLQTLSALSKAPAWVQPLYTGLTGGMLAWLAVQNMLLRSEFMPWVGLFVGGIMLGFLLRNPQEMHTAREDSGSDVTSGAESLKVSTTFQPGVIALLLVGLATLVASRLFGTTGWVVLAVGLLANRRSGTYGNIATLFLLGRVLLQAFLTQYSANVTGINITHPYASAALYVGFAVMLLLPGWLNAAQVNKSSEKHLSAEVQNASAPTTRQADFNTVPLVLLGLGAPLLAGVANYFLHGEATASLLLAMLVSGLGVSVLAGFNNTQARPVPMFLTLLTLAGVLAAHEVLDWGNEAEKSQKLIVLGSLLLLVLLMGFLMQQFGSGRKPVQVS